MVLTTHPHSPTPTLPLWINGAPHPFSQTDTLHPVLSSLNPTTPLHTFVSATAHTATLACTSAASTLASWRKTSPSHRRTLLLRAADIVERRASEIADAQMKETTCPAVFAKVNPVFGVETMRGIAVATGEIRGVVAQNGEVMGGGGEKGGLTITVREPVGVVLVIPPWNGAVILPLRAITMALAAGCTVVVKASELCPLTHHLLRSCFDEAGIPAGVVNMIQARREDARSVTEAVIAHEAVRKVDFIGSAAVGREIGVMAARHLKPVLMELGGKGPAVVLEDADLERAARLCAMGAILNHGQLCFSTERIIVHKSIAPRFLPLLTAHFNNIPTAGDAVTTQSADRAYNLLADAQEKGAEFLAGGLEYLSPTSLKPTLITNVSRDARIFDEETFGPSATVYVAEDDEDAVRIANDSAYGLSAAVHSTNWEHAYNVAREIECGQVHINNMTCSDNAAAPIQGMKGSGWGQSNSIWGINEFSIEKTLHFHPTEAGGFLAH